MLSVKTAGEQFMFRVGQLRKEYNMLWEHEYNGYHGLRSIDDVHLLTLDMLAKKRLTSYELSHCKSLISSMAPLMENPISFYLLSMIMLLDTSNLEKEYPTFFKEGLGTKSEDSFHLDDEEFFKNEGLHSFTVCVPSLSEAFFGNDEIETKATEGTKRPRLNASNDGKKKTFDERFEGIKMLQRHYTILLRNHWKHEGYNTELPLGDTDAVLKRAIESVKQITYYASFLMK